MILDDLLKIRDGGSSPRVTATEAGSVTLTRDATTGKVVVEIDKMPAEGLPIVVIADADTGTSSDKSVVVTIEAADELAFDTTQVTVATFPAITYADTTVKKYVRRVATQKKYLRSVITLSGSNGTFSRDFQIFVATGEIDE
ncbi:MAG: hypothetical protein WC455_15690 [Dehalococcoidia bacterium]|jgi:hypothetical protein